MTMRMQEGLLPQSDWMLAIEDDDAGHLAQRRDQAGNTLLHLVLNAAMDEIPELFNDEPHEAAADIEAVKVWLCVLLLASADCSACDSSCCLHHDSAGRMCLLAQLLTCCTEC
eukprot:m.420330 g.420330  ORF g.420330 m.420330 type:complete len:113 (-) comp56629_c0_seq81:582-920(-)